MKWSKCLVPVFIITAWLTVGCATMVSPPTGAQKEFALTPAKPAPYTGVKKRIAVAKFDAVGAYAAYFTGLDIGGGVAAQLTTALVGSGRFVVVERAALGDIQRERSWRVSGQPRRRLPCRSALLLTPRCSLWDRSRILSKQRKAVGWVLV